MLIVMLVDTHPSDVEFRKRSFFCQCYTRPVRNLAPRRGVCSVVVRRQPHFTGDSRDRTTRRARMERSAARHFLLPDGRRTEGRSAGGSAGGLSRQLWLASFLSEAERPGHSVSHLLLDRNPRADSAGRGIL